MRAQADEIASGQALLAVRVSGAASWRGTVSLPRDLCWTEICLHCTVSIAPRSTTGAARESGRLPDGAGTVEFTVAAKFIDLGPEICEDWDRAAFPNEFASR